MTSCSCCIQKSGVQNNGCVRLFRCCRVLSEEGALAVRVETSAGAHNQRRYKAYHPNFGLNEARLVFDSISISRFLSPRQKSVLISQLEGYLSDQEVHQLQQRVQTRICLMQNEKLLQTLQVLYQALDSHRCLDFTYCKFDLDGRQKPLKQYHKILPLKVVWEKEHYYLIALNPAHPEGQQQRNYRVDRMEESLAIGSLLVQNTRRSAALRSV